MVTNRDVYTIATQCFPCRSHSAGLKREFRAIEGLHAISNVDNRDSSEFKCTQIWGLAPTTC